MFATVNPNLWCYKKILDIAKIIFTMFLFCSTILGVKINNSWKIINNLDYRKNQWRK